MQTPLPASARLWYVRHAEAISGPFPVGALVQEDALGRLAGASGVSVDGERWLQPAQFHAILRDADPVSRDANSACPADEWSGQRAMARARWADQRSGADRRACRASVSSDRRATPDRRAQSAGTRIPLPPRRDDIAVDRGQRGTLVIALLLVAAVALAAASYGPSNPVAVALHVRPLPR